MPPVAALSKFCSDLEEAVVQTVRDGHVTKDLAICMHGTTKVRVEERPEPSLARPGLACGFIGH